MFELAADRRPDGDPAVRLHTLGTILLLHSCVETWFWVLELETLVAAVVLLATVFSALLILGLVPRFRRIALGLGAGILIVQMVWTFPYIANHTYLRLVALTLLALSDPFSLRENRLVHAALGWIGAIVLFYTGFQKFLYGTYFRGQYLAYMVSLTERFSTAFDWLIPDVELNRLTSIGPAVPGAGPYTVDAPAILLLANLVYLLEIGLAVGLILPRTRRIAIWITVALIAVIQLGARELFFGLLFCNLMLMLHPRDIGRKLLPLSVGIYVLALLLKVFGWGGLVT